MPDNVKNSAASWKIGIALLIGLFLIGMALSLVTAARRVGRVVDRDYYSHGQHYGATQDRAKNAGLDWTMTPVLSGTSLQVRVRDRAGAPVASGVLRFEPRPAGGDQSAGALTLAETAPGLFQTQRPVSAGGELQGTLRFTRGDATASRKLVLFN